MKLVVYDLDHTLMPIDTGDWWAKWLLAGCEKAERLAGETTLSRFTREYIEQTLNIEEFETWQMAFLASFERRSLEEARSRYKREVLEPIVPPQALALVEQARRQGCVTAICTATYRFATEPSAELFGVDHLLAVRAQEDARGNFTGRWIDPITYQGGKVRAVEQLVAELARRGVTIDAYEFWSDSAADMALFEFTEAKGGVCHVVNAREPLRQIAQARGWRVGRTFTDEQAERALAIVAKALAKRENAFRLLKKSSFHEQK